MASNRKDYYKILEVSKNATLDDIRKAYKRLAKKYHPDVCKEPGAEEKFKDIAEAYSILSDSDKRRRYDLGESTDSLNSASGSGFGFNDVFYSTFGSMFGNWGFGGRNRKPEKTKKRGKDLRITVSLTLDEIYYGVHKKYKIKKQCTCHMCHGSGSENNETTECPYCHGTGISMITQQRGNTIFQSTSVCEHCQGTGEIITDPCPNCHGTGLEELNKDIEFDVPPGMPDKSYFTIPGQGNDGPHRGVPGNLIVIVNELPNLKEIMRDEDNNLIHTHWLKPTDFIFGKEVDVPWIDGTLKVKIPAGTTSGYMKILKGKGMPNPNNPRQYADYVITFDCKFPKISEFTKEEKKLLEQLRKTEKI